MNAHNIHLKYRTPKRYSTVISIMPPGVTLIVSHSVARTTAVSNKVSWSKRGSSHRSSTVYVNNIE